MSVLWLAASANSCATESHAHNTPKGLPCASVRGFTFERSDFVSVAGCAFKDFDIWHWSWNPQ